MKYDLISIPDNASFETTLSIIETNKETLKTALMAALFTEDKAGVKSICALMDELSFIEETMISSNEGRLFYTNNEFTH
ncbi:hypothetical protein GTGU_03579 [Trabulsiella guamensis ATCC 49490]|uniref:Uncharacterized protein n=1 Tax=Trabulsiella guamensis ATCC 49490 TaxID=1005994 RepID=A0A084ZUB7_9ENTR|nr:hypothetical protein [Trabulsiella guamensis]KFC01062.1 hypothetical protein GTGU_03579 [Trabulsiella guamensis ATCC 49490]